MKVTLGEASSPLILVGCPKGQSRQQWFVRVSRNVIARIPREYRVESRNTGR